MRSGQVLDYVGYVDLVIYLKNTLRLESIKSFISLYLCNV